MIKNKKQIIFNRMPLTNNFRNSITSNKRYFKPSIEVDVNDGYFFLTKNCSFKKLKPKFNWLKCYEPESHLDDVVDDLIKNKIIKKNQKLCFLTFKDYTLSNRFKKKGFKKIKLIDPVIDLRIKNKNFLTETLQYHFQKGYLNKKKHINKYNFLFARHIFEHVSDLSLFIENAMNLIVSNGFLYLEVPDSTRAIKTGDSTLYWEEHNFYFTYKSFKRVLKRQGYNIVFYKKYKDSLENCIVAVIQKKTQKYSIKRLKANHHLLNDYYKNLMQNIKNTKLIFNFYKDKYPIIFYGASHLTFTFIELMGISNYVQFIIDDDKNKNKLFSPVGNLKIFSLDQTTLKEKNLFFLGLNPNHHPKVILKLKSNYPKSIFFSIFPKTRNYYLNSTLKNEK